MTGPGGPSAARDQPRVVVVGSVNADYVLSVDHRPAPGETVGGAVLEVHGGGKGANQAVAAAKCGASVELVACVGADAMGATRLADLQAHGVRTSHVRRVADAVTGVAVITLTPDGENDIIVAPGANAHLGAADVEGAASLLEAPGALLVQLEVPADAVERAVALAGPRTKVVLNCAPFRPLPAELLGRVDVLVANELEASALSGRPVESAQQALAAAAAARGLGPSAVVVTLGAEGAVVVADGAAEHVPAPRARVVDTTGAGDAFTGALAARLAGGAGLVEAVAFGTLVGSATTERKGAGAVVPADRPA